MAVKENIVEFLNTLKEDSVEEVREVCIQTLKFIEENETIGADKKEIKSEKENKNNEDNKSSNINENSNDNNINKNKNTEIKDNENINININNNIDLNSSENIKNIEKLKKDKKIIKIRDKTEFNTASQELSDFLDVINKTEQQLKKYDKNDIYYEIISLTLISLYNRAFMLTSSNKNRGIIHKEQAKHFENIGKLENAYKNYKYALYFNKRSGAKTQYEKLRKTHGQKDKIEHEKYKYKLLKNIKLIEYEATELKKIKRHPIQYEKNGEKISKKELLINYYKNKGYNVINTEFLYYYTYLLFLDLHYNIEISVNTTYHKEEVITRLKQLEKSNIKQEIKKAFQKIHEENPEDIETDKEIEKILIQIVDIIGQDKLLKIIGRNRLNQIYDCKYLPCKGIPGLLIYNFTEYSFADILTSEEKPKSRQMYWHYYISEKTNIPIEILIVNNRKENIEKIYYSK